MEQLGRKNTDERHVVAGRDRSEWITALLDQAAHGARLEIASPGDRRGGEQCLDVFGRAGVQEALAVRRAIRLLGALDDRARQVAAELPPEDVLLAQAAQLHGR